MDDEQMHYLRCGLATPTGQREAAAEIKRLEAERDQWNADARRLSGGLMAIRGAAETVPAAVLRSVAYDIALNCIEPDVAAYQIERRAVLAGKEGT